MQDGGDPVAWNDTYSSWARYTPRAPPQEPMRPILCCSWDLSEHEKWMLPSPNWDGLPVGRHFQNGHHQN